MTRERAREYVCSSRLTFAALRKMIESASNELTAETADQASRVNPGMTHRQALDILRTSIDLRTDSEVVSMFKTKDILIATNIVRECL